MKFTDLDAEPLGPLGRSMLRYYKGFGSKLIGVGAQIHLRLPQNYLGLPLVAANETHL